MIYQFDMLVKYYIDLLTPIDYILYYSSKNNKIRNKELTTWKTMLRNWITKNLF